MDYDRETLCLIGLHSVPELSGKAIQALIRLYGSAREVWEKCTSDALNVLGQRAYDALQQARAREVDGVIMELDRAGAFAVTQDMPFFPERLKSIPDAPDLLFVRGTLPQDMAPALAVVGARRDTRYGREQTKKIVVPLAQAGTVIVSGLARGIDTAAHEAALYGGGCTVAVLGNGILDVYPPENRSLADTIVLRGGAIVSEFAPKAGPRPYHFPLRNRLISGMSDALLLVEARLKSGTASTVAHALDQSREVFALPGNVDLPGSELPLQLLRDGAHLCTCASDIAYSMDWVRKKPEQSSFLPDEPDVGDDPVLNALLNEEKGFGDLMEATGLAAQELNIHLTMLELEGRIIREGGGIYALKR